MLYLKMKKKPFLVWKFEWNIAILKVHFIFQICFGCAFLDRFSGSNSNISQTQHETIGNLGHAEAATFLARRGNKQEEIEVELVDAADGHSQQKERQEGLALDLAEGSEGRVGVLGAVRCGDQ